MKFLDLTEGMMLQADTGFTCLDAGAVRTVQRDERGAFVIACRDGLHCLDGQCADNGDLIGIHQIIED